MPRISSTSQSASAASSGFAPRSRRTTPLAPSPSPTIAGAMSSCRAGPQPAALVLGGGHAARPSVGQFSHVRGGVQGRARPAGEFGQHLPVVPGQRGLARPRRRPQPPHLFTAIADRQGNRIAVQHANHRGAEPGAVHRGADQPQRLDSHRRQDGRCVGGVTCLLQSSRQQPGRRGDARPEPGMTWPVGSRRRQIGIFAHGVRSVTIASPRTTTRARTWPADRRHLLPRRPMAKFDPAEDGLSSIRTTRRADRPQ